MESKQKNDETKNGKIRNTIEMIIKWHGNDQTMAQK